MPPARATGAPVSVPAEPACVPLAQPVARTTGTTAVIASRMRFLAATKMLLTVRTPRCVHRRADASLASSPAIPACGLRPLSDVGQRAGHRPSGRALGRHDVAALLVQAGKARTIAEAITRYMRDGGPVVTLPRNRQSIEWEVQRNGTLRELDQRFEVGTERHEQEISAHFDAEDNRTVIRDESKRGRTVKPGLVLLQMTSRSGTIAVQF